MKKNSLKTSAVQGRKTYVFDTSTLIILFEKCGLVTAFTEFAGKNELLVPMRVVEEFFAYDNASSNRSIFQRTFNLIDAVLVDAFLPYFNFDSKPGELWVMSHVFNNPHYFCVIDEGFARGICELFNLNVTGAIGILAEMKKENILQKEDLVCIKNNIKNSHFYLSKKICSELDKICLSH